jgi:hypothetical protein
MTGPILFKLGDTNINLAGTSDSMGGMTSIGTSIITTKNNESLTLNAGTSIFFDTGGSERMRITPGGSVGIGTNEPLSNFHVKVGGDNGLIYEKSTANYATAAATLESIPSTGHVIGPCCDYSKNPTPLYIFWRTYNSNTASTKNLYFSNGGTAITFTGQHNSYSGNPNIKTDNNIDNYVGLIIKSLGIYRNDENDDITINNAWPVFQLTNSDNDKSVYGVITNRSDSSIANDNVDTGFYNGLGGKIRINSLGEGSMWVCNKNGSLENGDYITSTTVTGYGGKQAELSLHNYTVAKITCDCDFSLTKVVKRRIKLISDPTGEVISFDSQGNIEYENILDPDGNIQMVYPYDTRFLQADGTLLVDQTDYETRLANGESVYIACFVGCTYHCG